MNEDTTRKIAEEEFLSEYNKKMDFFREFPRSVCDNMIRGWVEELIKAKSR